MAFFGIHLLFITLLTLTTLPIRQRIRSRVFLLNQYFQVVFHVVAFFFFSAADPKKGHFLLLALHFRRSQKGAFLISHFLSLVTPCTPWVSPPKE